MKTYRTKEVANLIGIHPNTVRFYEEVGLITRPERSKNGYRIYSDLHIWQMRLIRLALRAEVLQNGLRDKVIEIIKRCAALDLSGAMAAATEYESMLLCEIKNTKDALSSVQDILNGKNEADNICLKRTKAAISLGITVDTLRNWERNGLITVKRQENGYRVYNGSDLKLLNIIRTLRCANYSLSSILRLINSLNDQKTVNLKRILNTPSDNEDIVSVCDSLDISLHNTFKDAVSIKFMIKEKISDPQTLQ
jgi:DNA-binding transcriptional MerR regulator